MLNTAELLPQNVSEELLSGDKHNTSRTKPKPGKSGTKPKPGKSQSMQSDIKNNTDLPANVLGSVTAKNVGYIHVKDMATLSIARQYLDILEKNMLERASEPVQTYTGADNLKQSILVIFEENPTESYTAGDIFERIQERDQKYYSDTLWGLWQQGFLIHPKRGKYQWNMER